MLNLHLDIEPQLLNEKLIKQIHDFGEKPVGEVVAQLVCEQLRANLAVHIESRQILRASVRFKFNQWAETENQFFLAKLTKASAIDLGDFSVSITTKPELSLFLAPPTYLKWQEEPKIKTSTLKRSVRHEVRMRWLQLRQTALRPAMEALPNECQCPQSLLVPRMHGVWDWALRFECKVCGQSYFCECFEKALRIYYAESQKKKATYGKQGWPWQFIADYERSKLRAGICHMCRNVPSSLQYCHPMYGSPILVKYGPYIVKTTLEKGINQREAENEIRDRLEIPRIGEHWVSEVELLRIVRDIFPSEEVIHQASPEWLGRQRLDIFVPRLKLAVEYHGQQHFEPVDFFGGETGLHATQVRDARKAVLCAEHGVRLITFHYDEELTREMVFQRINKAAIR